MFFLPSLLLGLAPFWACAHSWPERESAALPRCLAEDLSTAGEPLDTEAACRAQGPSGRRYSVRVGLETLPKDLSSSEVAPYFHLDGAVRGVVLSVRETGARMALAVEAGAVRLIGRLPGDLSHVPLAIIAAMAEQLGLPPGDPPFERPARYTVGPGEGDPRGLGCPKF